MMPKKSGIEFLNKFRKTNTSVPIIMLTANSQLEKKQNHLIGCDDY